MIRIKKKIDKTALRGGVSVPTWSCPSPPPGPRPSQLAPRRPSCTPRPGPAGESTESCVPPIPKKNKKELWGTPQPVGTAWGPPHLLAEPRGLPLHVLVAPTTKKQRDKGCWGVPQGFIFFLGGAARRGELTGLPSWPPARPGGQQPAPPRGTAGWPPSCSWRTTSGPCPSASGPPGPSRSFLRGHKLVWGGHKAFFPLFFLPDTPPTWCGGSLPR